MTEFKDIPDSEGHWILSNEYTEPGEETGYDVYLRAITPIGSQKEQLIWFATSDDQTDPCNLLDGQWKKISDEFQSRMKGALLPEPVDDIKKRFEAAKAGDEKPDSGGVYAD